MLKHGYPIKMLVSVPKMSFSLVFSTVPGMDSPTERGWMGSRRIWLRIVPPDSRIVPPPREDFSKELVGSCTIKSGSVFSVLYHYGGHIIYCLNRGTGRWKEALLTIILVHQAYTRTTPGNGDLRLQAGLGLRTQWLGENSKRKARLLQD